VCNLESNLIFLSELKNPKLGDFKSLNFDDSSRFENLESEVVLPTELLRSKLVDTPVSIAGFLEFDDASKGLIALLAYLPSDVLFILYDEASLFIEGTLAASEFQCRLFFSLLELLVSA
jgi:hypothetical protein